MSSPRINQLPASAEHPPHRCASAPLTPRSFIELLSTHPYFKIHALGASSRSAGKRYAEVTKWKLATSIPKEVAEMVIQECKPDAPGFAECGVVFSGLDHDVAGEIGEYGADGKRESEQRFENALGLDWDLGG
jgi:aspartate-semialdehyde dehydrogenase